jgi:hypothetical protein
MPHNKSNAADRRKPWVLSLKHLPPLILVVMRIELSVAIASQDHLLG